MEQFIEEYEPDEMNRIEQLKSHICASNTADKVDDDNITKDEKKKIIKDSLLKQLKNQSLHQMNIVANNDSDEIFSFFIFKI